MRAFPEALLDVDYSSEQGDVCATDEGWTNMDKDEVISKLADAGIRSGAKRNGNDATIEFLRKKPEEPEK
jgi:hypothetical protein